MTNTRCKATPIWEAYPDQFEKSKEAFCTNVGAYFYDDFGSGREEEMYRECGAMAENWDYLIRYVESPIELMLAAHLACLSDGYKIVAFDGLAYPQNGFLTVGEAQFQSPVGRVDFCFECRVEGATRRLVIECDGHEFHERTKEQAARDRSKDRWFQEQDIKILRFTGSEIYRDAAGCAEQITSVLSKEIASLIEHSGAIRGAVNNG